MAAGSIVVDLLARTSSFDTDIQRSTKAAEKRLKEMKETAAQWGAAVSAAFTGAALAGVAMSKQVIDGLDALNDVADATGSTVEKISALENVAARTGTSMDTVSTALVKFNQQLGQADGKDDFSRSMKQIGLDVEALKKMDPADALQKTAVALSKYADDGEKARLVQVAFGKSVKESAPFLKDLAENGELVATVTTEQAKQAEAFNQQLAGMKKNATDLGRSIVGDLLPPLNAFLNAMKESGGLVGFLTTGGGQTANPGAAINDINSKLEKMKKLRDDLDPSKSFANSLNDRVFGDVGDLDKQIGLLEKQRTYLKSLQQFEALRGQGDVGDALSRRMTDRPSVGQLPPKPSGKDPDADFKSYLNNLQQQLQKTNELTVSEKLLDDIRRGSLTVSAEQQKQLAALAGIVDKEKELATAMKDRMDVGRATAIAQGDAITKANEEYQTFLSQMKDAGPAAQLEKQREEMTKWAQALTNGAITQAEYIDGVTGRLGLVAEKTTEAKSMTEELGMTFASAFEDAVLGGGDLSDVFKALLQDIARVILRMQVMEPMMKQMKESMSGGGGGSSGGGWMSTIFSAVAGAFGGGGDGGSTGAALSGARADGGPVNAGGTYLVGERGPELFTPRTAGAILPNHAMGGARKENITVINQTTGKVDRMVEQQISPGERAIILQESAQVNRRQLLAALSNPNSAESKALGRNFGIRPTR